MHTIRPFNPTDAEYAAVIAVHNAAWPDNPDSVASLKFRDQAHNTKFLRQHFVVENDQGQIIAEATCGENSESYVPGKYNLGMSIHPSYDGQGVERQLYDYLIQFLNARTPTPSIIETYVMEDQFTMGRFFTDQGFQQVQRDPVSEIDLADINHDHLNGIFNKVEATGIELCNLSQLMARDVDWQLHCYQIFTAIEADVPSPDPFTPEPLAEFIKVFNHPNFLSEALFVALDQDQWVGISNLWKNPPQPERCPVGITGVLRTHRRRGIATALKLQSFQYARQNGIRYIFTGNEENNPMYDLNMYLAFVTG